MKKLVECDFAETLKPDFDLKISPNSSTLARIGPSKNEANWQKWDPHQSFLLEPLSEDSVLWKDVTQQEVVLLFLWKNRLLQENKLVQQTCAYNDKVISEISTDMTF